MPQSQWSSCWNWEAGQEAGGGSDETVGGMELAHLHSTAKLAYSERASFSRITLQCALTELALSVHISCRAPFVFRRLTAGAPLVGCVFMCSLHVMCDTYYNRRCSELNGRAFRSVDDVCISGITETSYTNFHKIVRHNRSSQIL